MWSGWSRRRLRRTTLISIGSAAFLAGLALVKLGWSVPLLVCFSSLSLLVLCWRRYALMATTAMIVVGLLVGIGWGANTQRELDRYELFINQKVAVVGTVTQDASYGTNHMIDFRLDHITIDGHRLPGQVRVTSFELVEPKQGDIVEAMGKLKPGFGGYQAGLYFAKAQVREHSNFWLATMRHNFSAAILNVIPEPQASLGLGFLFGIKSQLPQTLNDQLKIVGLTHIVVASGYNLTILVRAARRAFARRSKYQATLAAVLLMVGFVGVTGLSPSMSRAALVTSLSLAAWYYGRVVHPVVLLLFSAAVTAAINPLYVWGDVGWYLSFLAFGGVMLGAPLLQKRLFGKRQAPQLAQVALETLCAEMVTLPLTIWIFGSVSIVALPANVVVVPLIPFAMLATFVAGLSFVLMPGPGVWLALPAHWLLGYITAIVNWLASISWAKTPLNLTVLGMVGMYVLILASGWLLRKKTGYSYLSKGVVE